jgi:6-pyruvoyltetrahydropterin/6-carboxytetrahydropterin synthase
VVDYGDLKPFQDYIDTTLDHKNMNDVLEVPTTAENIAKHLHSVAWKMFHDVAITVRVSETSKTWAEYTQA